MQNLVQDRGFNTTDEEILKMSKWSRQHSSLTDVVAYLTEKLPGSDIISQHELVRRATIHVSTVCNDKYWDAVVSTGLKNLAKKYDCRIAGFKSWLSANADMISIKIDWNLPYSSSFISWPIR